jgi:DNA topoisomerase II
LDEEEFFKAKRQKKTNLDVIESRLEDFFDKASTATVAPNTSKIKRGSPPKPKKFTNVEPVTHKSDGDTSTNHPVEVVSKQRIPRRAAKAPVKYIEVSSEGDWDVKDDDDSFMID